MTEKRNKQQPTTNKSGGGSKFEESGHTTWRESSGTLKMKWKSPEQQIPVSLNFSFWWGLEILLEKKSKHEMIRLNAFPCALLIASKWHPASVIFSVFWGRYEFQFGKDEWKRFGFPVVFPVFFWGGGGWKFKQHTHSKKVRQHIGYCWWKKSFTRFLVVYPTVYFVRNTSQVVREISGPSTVVDSKWGFCVLKMKTVEHLTCLKCI